MSQNTTANSLDNWLLGFVLIFGLLFVGSVAGTLAERATDSLVIAAGSAVMTVVVGFLLVSYVLARH